MMPSISQWKQVHIPGANFQYKKFCFCATINGLLDILLGRGATMSKFLFLPIPQSNGGFCKHDCYSD